MFEIGEECRRRALRYFVEIEGMSYGEIVKFAHEGNANSRITKDTLKRLAAKMKADGEPLHTKVPQNFLKQLERAPCTSTFRLCQCTCACTSQVPASPLLNCSLHAHSPWLGTTVLLFLRFYSSALLCHLTQ